MNVHRIAAIVRLTLRDAVRSRVVLSLLAGLLLILLGLPLLVQSDGTPGGRLRVVLEYGLSAAVGLLSAATLWAACASVASELQDRRLLLVLCQPITRAEVWLAKWIGIVLLDIGALAIAGGVMAMQVAAVRPAGYDAGYANTLAARSAVRPVHADGDTPALSRSVALPPGGFLDMRFDVSPAPTAPMELRMRLGSARPERGPMACRWVMGPADNPVATYDATNYPGLTVALLVPTAAWADGRVHIRYVNAESRHPATVIADRGPDGIELLVPRGGFAANLLRCLLVVLARLAFLAALGVTAGCMLSMPVAVFMSIFVLVLLALSGYVETVVSTGMFYVPHEGEVEPPGIVEIVVLKAFTVMDAVTRPLLRLDPVPLLADGRRVEWALVARAAGVCGGVYAGIAALLGIWRFTRREVGLAGTD